jgi:hypothetical protein
VIKNAGDLDVAKMSVTSGDLVKRGAGRLTVRAPAASTTILTTDNGSSTNGGNGPTTEAADLGDDGTAPTAGYMGLNVAEGELVLKGDGDLSTVFKAENGVMVGLQTDIGTVQPALTVDGAKASFSQGTRFLLGGLQTTSSMAHRPRFTVRNGAYVSVGVFTAGQGLKDATFSGAGAYPTTTVENATVSFGSFRGSYYYKCYHALVATNSTVYCNKIETYGPNNLDVAGSVMQKNAAGDCIEAALNGFGEGTWNFRNGSRLSLSKLTPGESFLKYTIGITMSFDGATWETGGGTNPTFHLQGADRFRFRTVGAGLTLPVASGKTVNVARAISGDGPVVKTGDGALVFETQGTWDSTITTKTPLENPVSLAFGGELDVWAGTVSVESGACRQGGAYRTAAGTSIDFGGNAVGAASFAGEGSFSSFSASGAKIVSDGEGAAVPQFSSASFGGTTRVDFGCTSESPFDWQGVENLPVARFVGAAPDLSGWRVSGIGIGNVGGKFSFADGVVRVTLVSKGCIIVVQ